MDIKQLHERMIYPVVRVLTRTAGGSGVVVFSGADNGEEYSTFVLTNHHVIASAVAFEEQWDPLAGKDVKKEVRTPVDVDIFKYRRESWEEGVQSVQADIVAWDKTFDLALIQLRMGSRYANVADLYPRDEIHDLRIGTETITVGCSLGHKPVVSPVGTISSLDEDVGNQRWWMHSSPAIYGNSGGASYIYETGQVFGITGAIAVSVSGWSASPIGWLQYVIPISRVYGWLEDIHYDFIFDPTKTKDQCTDEREQDADEIKRSWDRRFRREQDIAQGGSGSETS